MLKTEKQIKRKLCSLHNKLKELDPFTVEMDEVDYWISALKWTLGEQDDPTMRITNRSEIIAHKCHF